MENENKLKKYIVIWYNYVAVSEDILFITAINEEDAAKTAELLMKIYGGEKYTKTDIDSIIEMEDDYFITYEQALEKYRIRKEQIENKREK